MTASFDLGGMLSCLRLGLGLILVGCVVDWVPITIGNAGFYLPMGL